jgi:trehalose 6-phosphate synthase
VHPLRDGMNLVAKEYCAASIEENSVLILSEFAGAAAQLRRGALLVNRTTSKASRTRSASRARWSRGERRARMKRLRHTIRRYDVFWWVDAFLDAALAPHSLAANDALPALEMDPALLRAANDAEELPDNPVSDTPPARRPHANLLN